MDRPTSRKVLLYHKRSNSLFGGDCYLPLAFAAALQRDHEVTVVLNGDFDMASAAKTFGLDIDMSRLNIVRMPSGGSPAGARGFLGRLRSARRLKELARDFDVCISTLNVVDFGKPGHHFICSMNGIEGKAFQDYVANVKTRTGLRRLGRKIGTWACESIVKPLFGIRPVRKIITDAKERIYPTSRYVAETMRGYFGPFDGTVFYPPTTSEFTARDVPRDPLKVIYVGRIFPAKRLTDIIAIIERARALSGRELTFDIAGELPPIPYSETLRQLAAEKPWIRLKGPVYGEDKERFMLSGTYAVHAERDETFGICISEYLKAGIIPVVPDGGGAREVADQPALTYHARETGAEILARLVKDDSFREEQRRRCEERAQVFSCSAYMKRQHEILETIVTSQGHPLTTP